MSETWKGEQFEKIKEFGSLFIKILLDGILIL
jgi:hypothetical protein